MKQSGVDFERSVYDVVTFVRRNDAIPYDITFNMTSQIINTRKGKRIMATKKQEIANLEKTISDAFKQAESLRRSFTLTEIKYKDAGLSSKSKTIEDTEYKEKLAEDIKKHLLSIKEDLYLISK